MTIEKIKTLRLQRNRLEREIDLKNVEHRSIGERLDVLKKHDDMFNKDTTDQMNKATDKRRHLEKEIVELRKTVADLDAEAETFILHLQYGAVL